MTLKFKYNIGDKVLLVKTPSYNNLQYGSFRYSGDIEKRQPKEYKISGYGFSETENGINVYYRLHAYCDEIIQYHNKIGEECLEPVGECHPFELESDVMSGDGKVIKLGDSVFYNLYDRYNGKEGTIPNVSFSTTSHGTVFAIYYFVEEGTVRPRIEVGIERDFLCTYCIDGKVKEAFDGRKYGGKSTEPAGFIDYGIRPGYAEEFAKEISKKSNRWYLEHHSYDIEQWLKFLGVYDETMAAIDKWTKNRTAGNKSHKKPKNKNVDEKLAGFISSLTEEQKKKLKEML